MTLATLKQVGLKHRRKIIIVGIGLVVLVATAVYVLWSITTWSGYKTAYESWQKELRTSIDAAVALPVTTTSERVKKVAAFKDVSHKISVARQSLCHVPVSIAWQHVIGGLHQREEACDQVISRADEFGKKMQATTTYLENEQALAAAIATALTASGDEVTETTWGSQVATWQNAGKAIARISSTETSFSKVKTDALTKVESVESAWRELIAAHLAKDKAKYLEAQAKLASAYGTLPSISTVSSQQLSMLATSLRTAYSQAFGSSI